jgi:hypothetical protein
VKEATGTPPFALAEALGAAGGAACAARCGEGADASESSDGQFRDRAGGCPGNDETRWRGPLPTAGGATPSPSTETSSDGLDGTVPPWLGRPGVRLGNNREEEDSDSSDAEAPREAADLLVLRVGCFVGSPPGDEDEDVTAAVPPLPSAARWRLNFSCFRDRTCLVGSEPATDDSTRHSSSVTGSLLLPP